MYQVINSYAATGDQTHLHDRPTFYHVTLKSGLYCKAVQVCYKPTPGDICFEHKYENYQNFSSESFYFLVVKFSIYLNRCVFVMSGITFTKVQHST